MTLGRLLVRLGIRGGALLAVLTLAVGTTVAAENWVVGQTRGTVFSLVGDKWEELQSGTRLDGEQVVRTLASGKLMMAADGAVLELGGGTAVQFLDRRVSQFSGKLTVAVKSGPPLQLSAGVVDAAIQGVVIVSFNRDAVRIDVRSGTVAVTDSLHGTDLVIDGGDNIVVSSTNGIKASDIAQAEGNAANNGNVNGQINGNAARSNAGGNSAAASAGANAGGNSANASANSNAGGNAANAPSNGNASGNSGDNGHNGSGNGNSGNNGNGNGNSGGNGNGNGNGN